MKAEPKLALYLMSEKGLAVLRGLLGEFGPGLIEQVVVGRDRAVENDFAEEIVATARQAGVSVFERAEPRRPTAPHLFAVSWRWLIKADDNQKLVVFHDSLLPRYRGFAPLVSALVNGEDKIGVTALLASPEYDRGPIIAQEAVGVTYPTTIQAAIERLTPCYQALATRVTRAILGGSLQFREQDETSATYSLWRDDEDYLVDWNWEASRIERFVNAVGFPYRGAAVWIRGKLHRLVEARAVPDVVIENRCPGKVIFVRDGLPVVVCGRGLLEVRKLVADGDGASVLPLAQFRTRFSSSPGPSA